MYRIPKIILGGNSLISPSLGGKSIRERKGRVGKLREETERVRGKKS
jgi:hypothetical protein